MESVVDHIEIARAKRKAREKARIEKLRELNLKKYNSSQPILKNSSKHVEMKPVKNMLHMRNNEMTAVKNKQEHQTINKMGSLIPKIQNCSTSKLPSNMNVKKSIVSDTKMSKQNGPATLKETLTSNKNILPSRPTQKTNRQSVFERLYKPKPQIKIQSDNIKTLPPPMNPKCLKKNRKTINELPNRRGTTFDTKSKNNPQIRRSISAVHFKRINKSELDNCVHKYASIGDKINSVHIKDIDEDETINQEKVVSAVKSERKKVKFMTPMSQNYTTPRPEDMQMRLKSWLQKRGKSFESYHHLQCFGINHMAEKPRCFDIENSLKIDFDDENKENIAVESDSDDGSYMDNIYGENRNKDFDVWRKASLVSESFVLSESMDTTLTSTETPNKDKDILHGALNDLTELLKEGYEWEQCARWLRAIRERFPSAVETAPYWECRAALEERRGDISASVECWEQAIAKGTERSVVEANLDQLLDKFMQLKISPNNTQRSEVDPKIVNMKNVFKSTIIRFAVKQGKLRQSDRDPTKYSVTPVRRSGRLSTQIKRTPFRECPTFKKYPREAATIKQLQETLGQDLNFVPNATLHGTP